MRKIGIVALRARKCTFPYQPIKCIESKELVISGIISGNADVSFTSQYSTAISGFDDLLSL